MVRSLFFQLLGLVLQRELVATRVWKPKFVCKVTYPSLHSWDLGVLQKDLMILLVFLAVIQVTIHQDISWLFCFVVVLWGFLLVF